MAITINDFRKWAGFSYDGFEGTKAVGLLKLTKEAGSLNQAFSIPKNYTWVANGIQFQNPEAWEISQTRRDPLDIAIQSVSPSARANIEAYQTWDSYPGLSLENPFAFTLGADPQEAKGGVFPIAQDLTIRDEILQLHLDTAISVCRSIIGLGTAEDFPENDPRVMQAVFLLSIYRLENNHTQQRQFSIFEGEMPLREQSYFRAKVYEPLLMQVRGLLSHLIKWDRQINGTSGEVARGAQTFRFYSSKA